jgi:spore germination cell wall hydrolase CwlJ-like protein
MSLPTDLVAALTDPQLLTLTIYGEARGEPIEGQIAVGCVIRNRVHVGRWGASYAQVCLSPGQFSCWRPDGGAANYQTVRAAAERLARSTTLPDDAPLRQCAWVAQGVIGHWIQDTVREATHYYAPEAMRPRGRVPAWAVGLTPVVTCGRHLFFAGVR